jgi:DNA-binding transcriptional regulator LsrR (DeoR family)
MGERKQTKRYREMRERALDLARRGVERNAIAERLGIRRDKLDRYLKTEKKDAS